ncbi:MAG: S8 family serine peptidase [Candidatus Izemoplasmatales bacterium]|nr:S8 family serine peptidase [Candidatus Izemoplasmatales bacterium]
MQKIIKKIFIITLSVMAIITGFLFTVKSDYFFYTSSISETLGPPWQEVPNEDYTSRQYNLDLIDIYEAWAIETGSSNITVAIIDSGIDTDHEEFAGRISELSYNAYSEEVGIAFVEDEFGHGTQIAGIIAATRNNDLGIDGLTDNIELMVIKVNAPGEETYLNSAIIRGIYYAVNSGADVLNLSFGSATADENVRTAIEYAIENEVFVVAAAGNDGNDTPFYPAAYDNVISVGSVDENALISDFSNYGTYIDLVAPGDLVYTTNINNGYAQVSGTSFAAPHVVGILALLLSTGLYSYEEIMQNLLLTSVDLGTEGKDIYYGDGLINAYNSLSTDLIKITFGNVDEEAFQPIWILANETYIISEVPTLENYQFVGWYLDEFYETALTSEYIFTQDTTVYGKFEPIYYTVDFLVDTTLYDQLSIMSGEVIAELPVIEDDELIFYGWFYDETFTERYIEQPVTSNLTLYAKFDEIMYFVRFLDAEDNLIEEFLVYPNDSVNPPESPTKASDELFIYTFNSWDQTFDNIQSDLTIRPIYNRSLNESAVALAPGVDTVYLGNNWVDTGVNFISDELSFNLKNLPNISEVGQYTLVYDIYFENEIVGSISRIVNVIEANTQVTITLNPGVTTIIKGTNYVEVGAISNIGDIEIAGEVDQETVGVYKITYTVNYEGIEYKKTRYVYVIDSDYVPFGDIVWFFEGDDLDEEN